MRTLKKTLADGNAYKFRTLTRREAKGFLKEIRGVKDEELNKLREKEDSSEGLTEEEELRVEELENLEMEILNRMACVSLCHNHPEFALSNDSEKQKAIENKLLDIMDYRDLNQISTFMLSGNLPKEEEIVVAPDDIEI